MKVKEFLQNVDGVKSIGIYDKKGNWLETDATPLTIIKYLDDEIVKTNFWVYDENHKTLEGKDYMSHNIKLNIYIDKLKEEDKDSD